MSGLGLALFPGIGASFAEEPANLEPPSNFAFSYQDNGTGVDVILTWQVPTTGATPDSYVITFSSTTTGTVQYNIAGNVFEKIVPIGYDESWDASIVSVKAGYDDSSPSTQSGTTTSPP